MTKLDTIRKIVYSKSYLPILLKQNPSLRGIVHEFVRGERFQFKDKTIVILCKECMYAEDNINHKKKLK